MKTLVIGYGSIGARHARLLKEQGHDLVCVTGNRQCPFPRYESIARALEVWPAERIVISNPTADHLTTLGKVLESGFQGLILVEKPLFHSCPYDELQDMGNVFVAYNFRFHPMLVRTKELLRGQSIAAARFHVGQYLPDWRPGTDYRTCYSADPARGGGVLRDLSHELDMALWLLGSWEKVTALGGHFSELEIASDDVFSLLLQTQNCPGVAIQLDYLCRNAQRGFTINASGLTVQGNLLTGELVVNGVSEDHAVQRDHTYNAQLRAFTSGETSQLCTAEQGIEVLKLIDAAEMAAHQGIWVTKQ